MNNDENIDGYIVQLPLPKHIDSQKILMAVDADKDVDGFHPTNFGKMALSLPTFISATPFGIMELLKGIMWIRQESIQLLLEDLILLEDQ